MNVPSPPTIIKSIERIILSIFFLLFLSSGKLFGQHSLSWEILEDVTYKQQFDKELQWYFLVPTFGEQPKAYENKTVIVEGYFIPADHQNNFHVLSRYPFSACFFCGGAGPESVVELQLDEKLVEHIRMDEKVQFQGELVLNSSDFDHLNYILKAARPIYHGNE
jgi:hypothetical protein